MTDDEMVQVARECILLSRRLADPSLAGDRQNEVTQLSPKLAREIVTCLLNAGNTLQQYVSQRLAGAS